MYAQGIENELGELPFTITAQRSAAQSRLLQDLLSETAELGVARAPSTEASLVSCVSGQDSGLDIGLEQSLEALNVEALTRSIDEFNLMATAPINTADLCPPYGTRKAVGD